MLYVKRLSTVVFFLIGVFVFAPQASAEIYEATGHSTEMSSSTSGTIFILPEFTFATGTLGYVDLYLGMVSTEANIGLEITCYTSVPPGAGNRCPNTEMGGTGHAIIGTSTVPVPVDADGGIVRFDFLDQGTSTTYRTFKRHRSYTFRTFKYGPDTDLDMWGTTTPNWCKKPEMIGTLTQNCTGNPYLVLWDESETPTEIEDFTTHVISTTPEHGATTTNSTTLGTSWYVASDESDTFLSQIWGTLVLEYQANPFNPVVTLLDEERLVAGQTDFSTTTTLEDGVYMLRSRIQKKYLGGTLSGAILDQEQIIFTVGDESLQSQAYINLVGDTYDYIATANATSTAALAATCNMLGGSFNMLSCMMYLFLPNPQRISAGTTLVKDLMTTKPPFGYFTLAYDTIMGISTTSAATSSLPSLTISLPAEFPTGGATVNLTPWDKLLGDGSILASAQSAGSNPKTLKEIVYPGWSKFVYLLFGLIIITQIIGLSDTFVSTETSNERIRGFSIRRRRS